MSPDGRAWIGDQPRGLDYWVRLHEIYQREIVDERDRFYLAMLRQLGHREGQAFEPDARLARILTGRTAAGELMAQANTFAKRSRPLVLAGPAMGSGRPARPFRSARPSL